MKFLKQNQTIFSYIARVYAEYFRESASPLHQNSYFRPCLGILVPWPGIEPGPLAVKVQSPKHWATSSVQFSCSVVSDSATLWTTACQASLSITNSRSLLKLMPIELVMPSSHLILCRPLLLPPSIFPNIRVFSTESVFHIRWPKYWSFSFSISPSSAYSGLISFRMDWLDLLAVQGTLKELHQGTLKFFERLREKIYKIFFSVSLQF